MPDVAYRTYSYKLQNRGIVARYSDDTLPPGSYLNLYNVTSRQENTLSSRKGLGIITTDGNSNFPMPGPVYTLGRMKGLDNPFTYAGAGSALFRKQGDGQGAFTQVSSQLSGSRFSLAPYRPEANSSPWMFIADKVKMLKDSGAGNSSNWGIKPPLQPVSIQPGNPTKTIIEDFQQLSTLPYTIVNYTGAILQRRVSAGLLNGTTPGLHYVNVYTPGVNNFSRTANVARIVTDAPHQYFTGMRVQVRNLSEDPIANVASVVITVIDTITFTYANIGPNNAGVFSVTGTVSPIPSIVAGMLLTIQDGGPIEEVLVLDVVNDSFLANFAFLHSVANGFFFTENLSGTIAANTTASISRKVNLDLSTLGGVPASDDDVITIHLNVSDPLAIEEIKLFFDVSDGSFTQDYYYKSISPATWQPAVSGTRTAGDVQTQRLADRAGARADARRLGYQVDDLIPTDLVDLRPLRPTELNTGANAWSTLKVRRGEFVQVGAAGLEGTSWKNVVAWKVTIQTTPNAIAVVGVDDIMFVGAAGLDSFAGQPYDYRVTYYNINTGDESNASFTMGDVRFLAVQRSPIQITWTASPDLQVTHAIVYRRGGTLTQAWYKVAQIPIASGTTYLDTTEDSVIETNKTLEFDNDPPVTSVMRVPVNTTITNNLNNFQGGAVIGLTLAGAIPAIVVGQIITVGTGQFQEQARVITAAVVGANTVISCYLNNPHSQFEVVNATASPNRAMDLMAIAFDKAWLAGDPDNPHVLYYSKPFRPGVFPPQNFLEVGTPDAPIMALIELRGMLYVITTKRIYQVFGAGSAIPTVVPTSVKHGLVAKFAWACSEGVIYYLSYDGVYMFTGQTSPYLTEQTEWVWTSQPLGPVPVLDPDLKDDVFMAYANHELFVDYPVLNGTRNEMVWNDVYQRWRSKGQTYVQGVASYFFAEDIGLFLGGYDDGNVYVNEQNNYDSGGFFGGVEQKNPISINIETAVMDQDVSKSFKVYNELTLDIDTQGQNIDVALLFDNGETVLSVGQVNTVGRQQVQINVNAGAGQRSLNIALLMTGSVTKVVTFFEVHIRAVVEAEFRKSFDSYWMKWGTDEFKFVKQGWFEYQAEGPVTFSMYIEGSNTARYTFTLPATTQRATARKRLPAVKAKMWRLIGVSASDWQFYSESHLETKPIGGPKGYSKQKLPAENVA